MHSRLIWPVAALLGEGPAWIDGALWFVDIKGGALHRYRPDTDERHTIPVAGRPSFVVPTDDGKLLVGDGQALRLLDGNALGPPLAMIPMPAHNRTNDATVDATGRLWFGTMDDEEARPSGAIYRFDGRAITHQGGECTITNGPALSPDGRWLYHVDTLARIVHRCSLRDGTPGASEPFITLAPDEGNPDGIVTDAEGCLWLALWGGWCVRRYSPAGDLLQSVSVPCAQVTKVAFGGPGLRTGYVTTARIGLAADALADQPLAGGVFAFDAPTPGLPLPTVRLRP